MGHIVHHAIVVTSWKEDLLVELATYAAGLGAVVIGPSTEAVNGYRTLTVCPDGSKEGWKDSDDGDARRESIKAWLTENRYEDGSSPLEWVEIMYGDDLYADYVAPQITDDQWRHR